MERELFFATRRQSRQAVPNPDLIDLTRAFRGQSNMAFLAEVLRRVAASRPKDGPQLRGAVVLLGGRGFAAQMIRTAQRHFRMELDPSYWSHALLLPDGLAPALKPGAVQRSLLKARVWESTLFPPEGGLEYQLLRGVSEGLLGRYASSHRGGPGNQGWPNIAVIQMKMLPEETQRIVELAADAPNADIGLQSMTGRWLDYVASLGTRPNPLLSGAGLPAMTFLQFAHAAADIDLAPGAVSENLCPEHLWQSAKWYSELFQARSHPITGFYCVRDNSGGVPDRHAAAPARRFRV